MCKHHCTKHIMIKQLVLNTLVMLFTYSLNTYLVSKDYEPNPELCDNDEQMKQDAYLLKTYIQVDKQILNKQPII